MAKVVKKKMQSGGRAKPSVDMNYLKKSLETAKRANKVADRMNKTINPSKADTSNPYYKKWMDTNKKLKENYENAYLKTLENKRVKDSNKYKKGGKIKSKK